ncbi:MAG: hypothetical protein WCO84_07335 [bacterium]
MSYLSAIILIAITTVAFAACNGVFATVFAAWLGGYLTSEFISWLFGSGTKLCQFKFLQKITDK